MARYESPEPVEIMDRLLWRDAQQMLDRHAQPGIDGRCEWCGWHWPCPPRRLAERAEVAATRPWRESWTAEGGWDPRGGSQHDLNSLRTLPGWRDDQPATSPASYDLMSAHQEAPTPAAPVRSRRYSGLFD